MLKIRRRSSPRGERACAERSGEGHGGTVLRWRRRRPGPSRGRFPAPVPKPWAGGPGCGPLERSPAAGPQSRGTRGSGRPGRRWSGGPGAYPPASLWRAAGRPVSGGRFSSCPPGGPRSACFWASRCFRPVQRGSWPFSFRGHSGHYTTSPVAGAQLPLFAFFAMPLLWGIRREAVGITMGTGIFLQRLCGRA
ncbi:hypothetical protein SDC9_60728 [bioreactor metagenome]|uniref:Uncharacterized protein n=1 Tax=bioreactor metagenome TaxID=1076179 RepID=A0A644XDR2_9ZZZZ